MGKWLHKLPQGTELRELINAETPDHAAILRMLLSLCAVVMEWGEGSKDDFEELRCAMIGEDTAISRQSFVETWGYDSADELVDDRLCSFYDLCDEHRIWIET